jgi:hypothetical protein
MRHSDRLVVSEVGFLVGIVNFSVLGQLSEYGDPTLLALALCVTVIWMGALHGLWVLRDIEPIWNRNSVVRLPLLAGRSIYCTAIPISMFIIRPPSLTVCIALLNFLSFTVLVGVILGLPHMILLCRGPLVDDEENRNFEIQPHPTHGIPLRDHPRTE